MAMSKKKNGLTIPSRQALEATVSEIATLKLQCAAAKAALELEIAAARDRRQGQLLALARQIESREAGVSLYCQKHRAELFPGKKSLDLPLATVGYRTEPPSVEKCSKKDTWRTIARRLEDLDWGCFYLTAPDPEVDKQALLADRARLTAAQLSEVGIRFQQDEVFYINPKSTVAAKSVREAAN
jgi:phage host-nuclease inhibitor protein Gam